MTQTFPRRFAFALVLGAASLVAAGTAHADGVTGTDPCPKGMICINSTPSTSSGKTSSATTEGSSAGAITQALLVLLGLA